MVIIMNPTAVKSRLFLQLTESVLNSYSWVALLATAVIITREILKLFFFS